MSFHSCFVADNPYEDVSLAPADRKRASNNRSPTEGSRRSRLDRRDFEPPSPHGHTRSQSVDGESVGE